MTVIVCANGTNERWGAPGPKVLADVHGEPLAGRTVRMVAERGIHPLVFAHDDDVLTTIGGVVTPGTRSVCETILYATGWHPTVVLLGDVWYAHATLDAALAWRGAWVKAWGTTEEIYAVAWPEPPVWPLYQAVGAGGKLWRLLRILDGLDPHCRVVPSMVEMVSDGTRDFDRREQLDTWLSAPW